MSYILEAIKRSERQRPRSGMAALRAAPVFAEEAHRPPRLRYGAAAIALIAAGIAIGWLRPWAHPAAPPTAATRAPAPLAPQTSLAPLAPLAPLASPSAPPAPLAQAPAVEHVEELQVMEVKPYRPRAPRHAAAAPHAAPGANALHAPPPRANPPALSPPPPQAPPAPRVNPAAATPAQQAAAASAAGPTELAAPTPPHAGRILALYELPAEVVRAIPAMSISGYSYSDSPQGRMVGINDHLVQEGQYVAEGLKLEQITREGLVFSYKNYRFLKRVP